MVTPTVQYVSQPQVPNHHPLNIMSNPSRPSNPKRKNQSDSEYLNRQRRARLELVEATENFQGSLQGLQEHPQFPYITASVKGILAGEPYTGSTLTILELPIRHCPEVPDQAIDSANERRVKLLELYRSALEAATRQRNLEISDVFHDRNKAFEHGVAARSPSEAAKVSALASEQIAHPMKIGRPFPQTGALISIYHPIFSEFKNALENPSSLPSVEDQIAAFDLMEAAAEVYDDEDKRVKAMRTPINKILARNMVGVVPNEEAQPNGIILHDVGEFTVPLLIMEAKNEVGAGGSDPQIQGAFSFRKMWVSSGQKQIKNVCCCPSFILSMPGPHITLHGGVYANEFIVQPLTETLALANSPEPTDRARYIAKIMVALRNSLTKLETFYNGITPNSEQQPASQWPAFQQYGDNKKGNLTYTTANLLSDRIGRAMFNAEVEELDDRDTLVKVKVRVKFTPSYGHEAHALLAEKNLAPQLRHYRVLENGWTVVVMDFVEGQDLDSLGRSAIPPRALEDIRHALEVLHEKNWVFGDLRRPNIMLCERATKTGGTEQGAMLVDFDWAGEHGKQRYPLGLNPKVPWADGVGRGGGIIEKKHDLEMFGKLKSGEV